MSTLGALANLILKSMHGTLGRPVHRVAEEVSRTILADGYRKPRTITDIRELAGMRDGTVIIGPDGLVGEKRDWPLDLCVRYVNGTQETNSDIPLPVTVVWQPEVKS